MASSQVEIVSSSPFGCVLRDHARKERCRESNVRAVLENNFKDLVRDHINGCIAANSQNQITHVASWERGNGNGHNIRLLNNNHHHHHSNSNTNIKNQQPSSISPKHSLVLDRWVTRQAQDVTASNINKHVNEAASPLLVPSNSNIASLTTPTESSSKTKNAQNFSTQLENATVTHNLGASSLVQIWEARLNRSYNVNSNQNQNPMLGQSHSQSIGSNSSRTSSDLRSDENSALPVEEPSTGDPLEEKFDTRTNNEDSLIDWESHSDRTALGEPPSCSSCSRSFDGGERERVRIADIIKRLKNGREDAKDHEHGNNITDSQSREHKHSSTSEKAEQRCFLQVVNSPRLRGRQAFNDLLNQVERDKNRELDLLVQRQSVSKFSQRGRLQSMLRLRCLQRSLTIQDKCRPQSPGAHGTRFSQGSTMIHLRGKFSTGAAEQNDSAALRCLHREVLNNSSIQLDKSPNSKLQSEETHCQKASIAGHQSIWPVNHLTMTMNRSEDLNEQAKPPSDASTQQKTSLEARCLDSLKTAEETTLSEKKSANEMAKKQWSNSQQHRFLGSQQTVEVISSLNVNTQNEIAEEQDNQVHHLSLDLQETTETITSFNSSTENERVEELNIDDQQHLFPHSDREIVEKATSYSDRDEKEVTEELEDHYQQYFAQTNYDWFSNISRPRSYWEDLRKAWYQEVLNTNSKNEEIRQLIESGRVSTFLASDFRERMDRLMISRVQIMQGDGAASLEEVDDEDRMVQVKSYLQRHLHPAGAQAEEEVEEVAYQDDEDEEEDEEMSITSRQLHDANNYFNQSSSSIQMPSPSDLMGSWRFQDDNETSNDSDQGPSTFSSPPGASQAQYYKDTRQSSSSISQSSFEMELIYDLRGHIEQLQHEMGELRKSILSCMDMQMKLQQYSFNRQLFHSGEGEGKNSAERAASLWKRSCCICFEMQVDSLLYRCGHMCTCLKCAHELQWSSGKCPICRAPILDVVPTK